jgi:hypothetical protein
VAAVTRRSSSKSMTDADVGSDSEKEILIITSRLVL